MDSLHDALIERAKRQGMAKAISASLIIESANRILPARYHAAQFKNNVLTIAAPTASEGYLLKQELETYLERINAALPEAVIKELKIRIQY